ncbi:hypothetical protein [Methanococcus voltae]|uniref:Uncharacterized membrane protein YciS (DUF1049 family) n=1 Tax=Methanococcus voltae PS TaxID=523842 RepID=A0ABT2EZY3_METVO|nr:hypothetical protein [Methanococcus voltae]MBP2171802.1 uncharacterized membrane protein YciS (DUF1049 family) [Methanococcus voltae]MCS3922798.1 uncharacterized membrane protein YciS (DUF1049 family) [Methanococcus voltae PS]
MIFEYTILQYLVFPSLLLLGTLSGYLFDDIFKYTLNIAVVIIILQVSIQSIDVLNAITSFNIVLALNLFHNFVLYSVIFSIAGIGLFTLGLFFGRLLRVKLNYNYKVQ